MLTFAFVLLGLVILGSGVVMTANGGNCENGQPMTRAAFLPGDAAASADDRAIPGPDGDVPVRVYRPHGDGAPRPAVVFAHGGGCRRASRSMSSCPSISARIRRSRRSSGPRAAASPQRSL
mgnify:CR=1 FL=1